VPGSSVEFDPNGKWTVHTIPTLSGGVNTAVPEYLIDDAETVRCINMTLHGDRVRCDTGYVAVGTGTTLVGRPKGAFQHRDASGNSKILLVTDNRVYEYAAHALIDDEWVYVSDGNATAVVAPGEGIGDTVINVADTAGFVNGRPIGVTQNDGSQHQALIVGIGAGAPGTITIDVGLTVASAATKVVVQGFVLTGNDDNQVVFAAVPSNEWVVFTNGVNYPMRYDGATVEVIPNLPSGGNFICKTLSLYKVGYLLLGNLIEGGTARPYKVVWCDAGDPTNWSTGDASYVNLVDVRDDILCITPLGDYVIVYRSRSVVRGEFLGLPVATFLWRTTIHGLSITSQGGGVVSANSVFALPGMHIFAGRAGIFGYDGGFSVEEISKPIYETVFSSRGDMDGSKLHRSFISYVDKEGELYYHYCAITDTFPKRAAVLDIRNGKWRTRLYQNELTFAVDKQRGAGEEPRIMDLVGTIGEQSWIIGGAGLSGDSPVILLGGPTKVYEYDFVVPTEDGATMNWLIITKRFRTVNRYSRYKWFELDYKGGPIAVLRKYRGGWVNITTLPMSAIMTRRRVYDDHVSKGIQYWFWSAAAGSELGVLSMKYREEGYWSL